MKTKNLLLILLISLQGFSQDSLQIAPLKTTFFSISPMSRKVEKVNGLVLGVGHIDNRNIEKQTINGLNLEVNPAPAVASLMAFMAIMYIPEIITNNTKKNSQKVTYVKPDLVIKNWDKTPLLSLNGINISTGCFFTTTNMNGLNISLGNKFKNFNGVSVAPLGTISDKQNGISLGLVNCNNKLNGTTLGFYNQSYKLNGLQIGVINQVNTNSGLQIGIYNKSYSNGFQLGVWNKNSKRSLPILNW